MERDGVIEFAADSGPDQVFAQFIPARASDRVLVEDVTAVGVHVRRLDLIDSGLGKEGVIAGGICDSPVDPLIEVFEFDAEDGGLECIEARVDADDLVVVLGLHAVDAEDAKFRSQGVVFGRHQTAVAGASEVFGRKEAEAADRTHGSGAASAVIGADGLGGILDDGQVVASGDLENLVHACALPVDMNWHDGAGARGDGGFDPTDIDIEVIGIDIDINGSGAEARDGAGRSEEGPGGGDDLVSGADIECHQSEQQGV